MRKASAFGIITIAAILSALPAAAQQSGGASGGSAGANGGGYDNSSVYSVASPRTHATNTPNDPNRYRIRPDDLRRCGGFIEVTRNSSGRPVYFCHASYGQ